MRVVRLARHGTVAGTIALLAGLFPGAATGPLAPPAARAADPEPASVTIAGSLQSELGCPGDWQPDCAVTSLTFDAADGVWQGSFTLPAGSYEYKAALNGTWDVSYGAHGGGGNVGLTLAAPATVKFYYSTATHWVTDNRRTRSSRPRRGTSRASSAARATGSRTASAPGSRTLTATASTPSKRRRSPSGPTRARSPSTKAGPRTTAPVGRPAARTSASPSPAPAAR